MRTLKTLLITGVIAAQSAWAVPSLQLDIEGGTFENDTTFSAGGVFNLWALGHDKGAAAKSGTYYISAAITPNTSNPASENFGSFVIDGTTYDINSMLFGSPTDLPSHSAFDSHYVAIPFSFGAATVPLYNVDPSDDEDIKPGSVASLKTFAVDATGLTTGYTLHFDLYTYDNLKGGQKIDFAPFSHDAESTPGTNVPDGGATAVLLGLGIAGLALARKRS